MKGSSGQHPWLCARAISSLSNQNAHIWRCWLDQPAWLVERLARTLSVDECIRADRFHFETERRRFIVGRGVLRAVLGRYLSVEPRQLQFRYSRHGKPYLQDKFDQSVVRFNVAHSHQLAVYAFTRAREIGIDLEYMRPMSDVTQIAARFFSARENAAMSELPTRQKQEAFYLCWTRKEAYLKAIGNGLGQPSDPFDVSLVPGEPARLLNVEGKSEEARRWTLVSLTPARGYAGALVLEGHDRHLTFWDFDGQTELGSRISPGPVYKAGPKGKW